MTLILRLGFICVSAAAILIACKKNTQPSAPTPVAGFAVETAQTGTDSGSFITCPTYAVFSTKNLSTDATEYVWDFGDGRTSAQPEPAIFYHASGTYDVILTANANGRSDTSIKKIQVVDRLIKSINISSVNWNASFADDLQWDHDDEAEIFFRLYERDEPGLPAIVNQQYDAEQIYESAPQLVTPAAVPIILDVNEPVIMPHPDDGKNRGYCLYAKKQGKEYLLISSWGSGFSGLFADDYRSKTSKYHWAFNGMEFEVNATY